MTATARIASSAISVEGYCSVPLAGLQFLEGLQINLYRCRKAGAEPLLINDAKWKISEDQLVELKIYGDRCLFFAKQDLPSVMQSLLDSVDEILAAKSVAVECRFALLQLAHSSELQRVFRKTMLNKFVALAEQIGRQMANLAGQGQLSVTSLFQVLHHNSQHYTHLTNVAAYGLTLAKSLKQFSQRELEQIAVGCLLHEVGKLYLPADLLSKQGRLSAKDTQELERIPQLAYEALLDFEQLNFGQLMMAYQQHERVDGTGYPVRSLRANIHPWAKLLAVADELDAITCQRPYRDGVGLEQGLLHLTNLANDKLDPKMVLCLITNSQST